MYLKIEAVPNNCLGTMKLQHMTAQEGLTFYNLSLLMIIIISTYSCEIEMCLGEERKIRICPVLRSSFFSPLVTDKWSRD